ncbi:MAG: minor capsid protein [Deferribacteraceae bacterium]|jgi:SPP1 gp7 family putative phage head morphogenesis protein|nr:minor capsid protein [Deferribacteraceae bacterium]
MKHGSDTYTQATAEMLFGAPPEMALEYFGGKEISKDWRNVYKDAHTKAFIIANETRSAVLKDVYGALQDALYQGKTLENFRKDAIERLSKSGWLSDVVGYDDNGNPIREATEKTTYQRLERIYSNNLNLAYAAGRYTAIMDGEFEFVEYLAVLDNRTRDSHRELHGKLFSTDDPVLKYFAPPNGYGCRCMLRGVTENQVKKRGLDPETLWAAAASREIKVLEETDPKTGEVTTYHAFDMGNGELFRAQKGWDYNPSEQFWRMRTPAEGSITPPAALPPSAPQQTAEPKVKPVKDFNELKQQLEPILKPYIQNQNRNNSLKCTLEEYSSRSFMETNSLGRIGISTSTHPISSPALQESGKTTFRMNEELLRAWNKIANSNKLTPLEEYSIESLWHEVTHNKQKYAYVGKGWTKRRAIMEIITQWTARRTYNTLLNNLGWQAEYSNVIKKHGLGYRELIQDFDKYIKSININEDELLKEMLKLIDNTVRSEYEEPLVNWLSVNGKLKKSEIKNMLSILWKRWEY